MARQRYTKIVLDIVPRILSSIDDNPLSKTYGCVDKAYWFYKTKDFPCARLQEAGLTLALLYKYNFPGNIYHRKPKLRNLAVAVLNYTSKIQHIDGSFDEWYPNEHSFCATAFVTYSMSELYLHLGLHYKKFVSCFRKSAGFLMKTKEKVVNQQAGSLIALYNLYLITKDKKYLADTEIKLNLLRSLQSEEGWFDEYGGADIGYLTVTLDCLGKYYQRSKDKQALEVAKPAISFLKYFIHPDGSLGGIYGSRGTEFKFPHGLEIFSKQVPDAGYIAKRIYSAIDLTVNPRTMDDRYALIYNVPYLQACLTPGNFTENCKLEKTKLFKHSGLYVHKADNYYFVCNLKKGGVYVMFKDGRRITDSGIFVRTRNKLLTSQWLGSRCKLSKDKLVIFGSLFKVCPTQQLSQSKTILMRLFSSTLGNCPMFAGLMKNLLRSRLIKRAKKSGEYFRREIRFGKRVSVMDSVSFNAEILSPADVKARYVPTSRFWNGAL